jgi:serine/threonine protein kinase
VIQKEAEIWANLRHPHVLRQNASFCDPAFFSLYDLAEFLGADLKGEVPFIVMPYLEHGNARDFIERHPDCNRNKIVSFNRGLGNTTDVICKIALRCHSGTRLSPQAQRCAWRYQRGTLTNLSSWHPLNVTPTVQCSH